jgi:hypothetical protein
MTIIITVVIFRHVDTSPLDNVTYFALVDNDGASTPVPATHVSSTTVQVPASGTINAAGLAETAFAWQTIAHGQSQDPIVGTLISIFILFAAIAAFGAIYKQQRAVRVNAAIALELAMTTLKIPLSATAQMKRQKTSNQEGQLPLSTASTIPVTKPHVNPAFSGIGLDQSDTEMHASSTTDDFNEPKTASLQEQPWFHGPISTEACELLLNETITSEGAFLVRSSPEKSETAADKFVLSYRPVQVGTDQSFADARVQHCAIERDSVSTLWKLQCSGKPNVKQFKSVSELIEFCSQHDGDGSSSLVNYSGDDENIVPVTHSGGSVPIKSADKKNNITKPKKKFKQSSTSFERKGSMMGLLTDDDDGTVVSSGAPVDAASVLAPAPAASTASAPLPTDSGCANLPAGMVLLEYVPCRKDPSENQDSKFIAPFMVMGKNTLSAVGLTTVMGVDPRTYRDIKNKVQKIVDEFKRSGTKEDNANVERLMNGTYSNPKTPDKVLPSIADIMSGSSEVEIAGLQAHHVLALRLYTTSSYKSINNPMRQQPYPQIPHPFAGTLYYIGDGLAKLRAVQGTLQSHENKDKVFYRGMIDLQVTDEFLAVGGTEMSCMSTTSSKTVAADFAKESKTSPLLFKLLSNDFMSHGADISFLSVYPEEKEILYPPLTYLCPINREIKIEIIDGREYQVVEVKPSFGSLA